MILKTRTNNCDLVLNPKLIVAAINLDDNTSSILMYGSSDFIKTTTPFAEIQELIDDNTYSGGFVSDRIEIDKEFPLVEIGNSKFQVNITKIKNNGDKKKYELKMIANFNVKNDIIKEVIEKIEGVEDYNKYSYSKYNCPISVGQLFDIEKVREEVEQKIKECIVEWM